MLQRHFFKKSLEDGFLKDSLKTKRTCEKTNICLFKLWHFERKLELKIFILIFFRTPDYCGADLKKLVLFNRFWKPRPGGADSSGEETFMDSNSDWEHLLLFFFFREILSDIIIWWLKYESGATVHEQQESCYTCTNLLMLQLSLNTTGVFSGMHL